MEERKPSPPHRVEALKMMRDGMSRKIAFQQRQAQEAEDIKALKARWTIYSLPLQAVLETHLKLYGYSSAYSAAALVEQVLQEERRKKNATPDDGSLSR